MDPLAEGLEFLDWGSLAERDRSLLHCILFGEEVATEAPPPPVIEGPVAEPEPIVSWADEVAAADQQEAARAEQEPPAWQQQQQNYEIPAAVVPTVIPSPRGAVAPVPMYQPLVPPPVAAALPPIPQSAPPPQQPGVMYPPMMLGQGICVNNLNLSVNANVHSFVPMSGYHQQQQQQQNHQVYESYKDNKDNDRRQRGGPKMNKPKSNRDFKMAAEEQYQQHQQFMFHNQHPQYGYMPHPTTAQHVSGPPLYISAPVQMYSPNPQTHQPPLFFHHPQQMYMHPMQQLPMQQPEAQQTHVSVENLQQQQQQQQHQQMVVVENQQIHNDYSIPPPVSPQPVIVQQIEEIRVEQVPIQEPIVLNETKIDIATTPEIPLQHQQTNIIKSEPEVVPLQKIPLRQNCFETETLKSSIPPPPFKKRTPDTKQSNVRSSVEFVSHSKFASMPAVTFLQPEITDLNYKETTPSEIKYIPEIEPPQTPIETVTLTLPSHNYVEESPQPPVLSSPEPPTTPVSPPQVVAPAQPPPAKSWASIVQASTPVSPPLLDQSPSTKPLARVNPYTQSDAPNVAQDVISPLAKTKSQMSEQDHLMDDPLLFRLGEYLCKYQLDHRSSALQPRGLTNRSNWCYVNATLQALLACPPFFNLMRNLPAKQRHFKHNAKSPTPIIDAVVEFMQEFSMLPAGSRPARKEKNAARKGEEGAVIDVPQGPPFEPSCVYAMLGSIRSAAFKVEGRQEDAEEFLSCLLNALNDEMLELMKLVEDPRDLLVNGEAEQMDAAVTTNGDTHHHTSEEEGEEQWTVMRSKNRACLTRRSDFGRSPVSDIFRGQLCSHVQRKGEQQSENVQPFYTLQLDIEKSKSVREALEQMVDRDWLEGVTCSRTHQQVEAWQQVTLEELPPVLLLHLKWFDYKQDGCSKIMKNMEYTVDLKIENKLLSNSKAKYTPKQRIYKLFAVVYHDGKEASKGHYITDAYHAAMGVWVRYDDSQVRVVPEHVVTHPRLPSVPYILYYRRSDTMGLPSVKSGEH